MPRIYCILLSLCSFVCVALSTCYVHVRTWKYHCEEGQCSSLISTNTPAALEPAPSIQIIFTKSSIPQSKRFAIIRRLNTVDFRLPSPTPPEARGLSRAEANASLYDTMPEAPSPSYTQKNLLQTRCKTSDAPIQLENTTLSAN